MACDCNLFSCEHCGDRVSKEFKEAVEKLMEEHKQKSGDYSKA